MTDEQDSDGDGESNVAHWMVSFEGDAEEHEVTEKYIGRLIESSETESIKSADDPPSPKAGSATSAKGKNAAAARKEKSPPRKAAPASPHRGGGAKPSTRSTIKDGKSLLKGIKAIKKQPRGKELGENESVVKVKMLTGTLYLFRGENPRAEFVRTV